MSSRRDARSAALLAVALVAVPAFAAEAPKGKAIYDVRCVACHGPTGGGDGPAAAALDPRPRNFRDVEFWKSHTPEQLRDVVKHGKPGTLMAPFEGVLSDAEIDDVVRYLATFRPATH